MEKNDIVCIPIKPENLILDADSYIDDTEYLGLDYDQLGPNEKEWVNDELDKPGMFIDDEEWEKEMGR